MNTLVGLSSSIIGKKCSEDLLVNFNYQNVPCLKLLVSKILSFGIIFGSIVVKVPQIVKIVDNQSAEGLSFLASLLETLSSLITFAYNLRAGNPFSTFGETLFINVQNILITLLILFLNKKFVGFGIVLLMYGLTNYLIFTEHLVNSKTMAMLQACTIPIFLLSRLPQIWINFKSKSTGQLSALTVLLVFAGSVARVFTTMQEVKDTLLLFGFASAAILNSIIAGQLVYYWKSTKKIKTN